MAIMMSKLYAALCAGNVLDDEAQQAAEEIAGYENRFTKLESDLNLLKRMIGFNLVMTVAIISKLFAH
jgi:hypothetical protein